METNLDYKNGNVTQIALQTVPSITCRICQNLSKEELITPCHCKGTVGHVHRSCLQQWMSTSMRSSCEICSFKFRASVIRRYNCLQSLCVWLNQPDVLRNIVPDTLSLIVITTLTIVVCVDCVMYLKERKLVKNKEDLNQASSITFLVFAILLCTCALVTFLKTRVLLWYNWWTSCVNVTILFDDIEHVQTI